MNVDQLDLTSGIDKLEENDEFDRYRKIFELKRSSEMEEVLKLETLANSIAFTQTHARKLATSKYLVELSLFVKNTIPKS
jgi:hypothetical protein